MAAVTIYIAVGGEVAAVNRDGRARHSGVRRGGGSQSQWAGNPSREKRGSGSHSQP